MRRLILVDLFRLICIFFIVEFHAWAFAVGGETSFEQPYPFYRFLEQSNALLFDRSGVWIAAISFFLFGFTKSPLGSWRFALFIFGTMALQFVGSDESQILSLDSYTWGVFSYILVGYLALRITRHFTPSLRLTVHAIFSALFLVPHSTYTQHLGHLPLGLLRQALIGEVIDGGFYTGWFLLPWAGMIFLMFEAGSWMRARPESFARWHRKWDLIFALGVGLALIPLLFSQPHVSPGLGFNRRIFWLEPADLAFSVIFPLWVFRLAQLESVHRALGKSNWAKAASELCWNRHFWFCYIFHVALLFVVTATLPQGFLHHPAVVQSMGAMVLVAVDLVGRRFFVRLQAVKQQIRPRARVGG